LLRKLLSPIFLQLGSSALLLINTVHLNAWPVAAGSALGVDKGQSMYNRKQAHDRQVPAKTRCGVRDYSLVNLKEATRTIENKINETDTNSTDKPCLVVQTELTIERQWGWVFFYNSQRFVESGNVLDALAGNAPYLFNRVTDEIFETGT